MPRIAILMALFLLFVSTCFCFDPSSENLRALCNMIFAQQLQEEPENASNITEAKNVTQANFTFSRERRDALLALEGANASMEKMRRLGIPTRRAQDLYLLALQWFNGQSALEMTGERGEYGFVVEKASEVKKVERTAIAAHDDLRALSVRMRKTGGDVNISEAISLYQQAKREFDDERFEEAQKLINEGYDSITKAEAEATRQKALLESARRNIETFLQENWQKILIGAAAIAIFAFLFQKQIRRFLINAKIRALMTERAVLEGMIKNLQKDYFESGKINELSYHIKTKKYSDFIRNINRQLPLLKEELKRI
ncbi:MAG: hypothetical protein N3E51_02855 [Candidatus Micrarchaeota archaeon]|nr:hypothetical protein [Candidatus Micrarchaeota archaeon]